MQMEWIRLSIAPVKDLVSFLHQKAKTQDALKKQLFMELRNNLNIFSNGYLNEVPYDRIIDLLEQEAFKRAVRENFAFRKLKSGKITEEVLKDERNRKYLGWTAEKLLEKIDEKITELKHIKQLNGGSVLRAKNNIPLMMSNLYFRLRLLADFIRSGH